jgi:hypothetical protein
MTQRGGFTARRRQGLRTGAPALPQARPLTGGGMFARGRRKEVLFTYPPYLLCPAPRHPELTGMITGKFGSCLC